MPIEHPSVAQARIINNHISGPIARSDEMDVLARAVRYVMDNHRLAGVALLSDALARRLGIGDFRPPDQMPPGSEDPTCGPAPAAPASDALVRCPPTIIPASSGEHLRNQNIAFAAALGRLGMTVSRSIWLHPLHAFHLLLRALFAAARAVGEAAALVEDGVAPLDRLASVGAQND